MTMVGLVMMIELILGILGFGESHNNLTGSNAVSREYNISIINFAIINTDIVIKLWYYDLIIWEFVHLIVMSKVFLVLGFSELKSVPNLFLRKSEIWLCSETFNMIVRLMDFSF